MPKDGDLVAQGTVPFVRFPDGRLVMARFVTLFKSPGPGWNPEEHTSWALEFEGQRLRAIDSEGKKSAVWVSDVWARGDSEPLAAQPDGERFVVSYRYYWGHTLGSITGDLTCVFDLKELTVTVTEDLEVGNA